MPFENSTAIFDYFVALDWWNMIMGVYTLALGNWFFVIAMCGFGIFLMMRGQSIALVSVILIATTALFYSVLPREAIGLVGIIGSVFFMVALVRFFTGGEPN